MSLICSAFNRSRSCCHRQCCCNDRKKEKALKKYIEELRKSTEEKIKGTKREYEDKIEAGKEARRKDQVAKFRDDLYHKTNPGEVLTKSQKDETLNKGNVVEADGVETDGVEPE